VQTTELAQGETWTEEYGITPTMEGERLRLVFLLYEGEPPANPTLENAYRSSRLWVNVSAS
jgi:uncharacterized membrane protein